MPAIKYTSIVLSFAFLFFACGGDKIPQQHSNETNASQTAAIKKQFIVANQQLMQKENDEMDYYVKSHKMAFIRTGSGVRYYVYKHSQAGDSIRNSMTITMDYEVRLLDGTLCYSSATEGKKTFLVGQEEIESGIHKGVLNLKRGDKALLLIPSPLAHGLLGDFKKIPPQMPILYDVQIY